MTVFSLWQPTPAAGNSLVQGVRSVIRWARRNAQNLTWRRELFLVALLYGMYELSRGFASSGGVATAMSNGRDILKWETWAHLDPEHALNASLTHSTLFAVIAAYDYSMFHYIVTPAVLIWMFRKHTPQYRFARTTLAWSTVVGFVGFYLVPTAPPRLLAGSGLHDTLADVSNWGWWSDEGSVPRGLGGLSNQFAAMPSLHVGWAVWAGVLMFKFGSSRLLKVLGVVYPTTTMVVVMATGNHYLLDVVAGAAAIALAAWFTRLQFRRAARFGDLELELATN